MYQTLRTHRWKRVERTRTTQRMCPRCGNDADFFVASDTTLSITFLGITVLPLKKAYALKCPICPHYAEIEKRQAGAFID